MRGVKIFRSKSNEESFLVLEKTRPVEAECRMYFEETWFFFGTIYNKEIGGTFNSCGRKKCLQLS